MSDIRTGPEAADVEASWHTYTPRACLNAVSRAYQYGTPTSPSKVEPIWNPPNATAAKHWAATPQQYRHTGLAAALTAPKGALIQFSNGDGHIIMSQGFINGVHHSSSTDFPSVGKLSVAPTIDIINHFSGNKLEGWGEWINGRHIEGLSTSPSSVTGYGYGLTTAAQLAAQEALTKLGLYHGDVDGEFGSMSVAAMQQLLKNEGHLDASYKTDGVPGPLYGHALQHLAARFGYDGADDGVPAGRTSLAIIAWAKSITDPAPPPPPVTQTRTAGATVVNRRPAASKSVASVDPQIAASAVVEVYAYALGDEITQGGVTSNVWFQVEKPSTAHPCGLFSWSGAFTSQDTSGLSEVDDAPAVVTPPAPVSPYQVHSLYMDVSGSQLGMDYASQKAAGIDGLIVKWGGVNAGAYGPVSSYATHCQGARDHGMRLGHYFFTGTALSPTAAADFFVSGLLDGEFFDVHSDVLMLDNEGAPADGKTFGRWTIEEVIEWVSRVVALTGIPLHRVWLYQSASGWKDGNDWYGRVVDGLGVTDVYAAYGTPPYATGVVPTQASNPEPPNGRMVDLHQFTSAATVGNFHPCDVIASPIWTADELWAEGVVSAPAATLPDPGQSPEDSGAAGDSGEDSGDQPPEDSGTPPVDSGDDSGSDTPPVVTPPKKGGALTAILSAIIAGLIALVALLGSALGQPLPAPRTTPGPTVTVTSTPTPAPTVTVLVTPTPTPTAPRK